jgi:hypothetical protein
MPKRTANVKGTVRSMIVEHAMSSNQRTAAFDARQYSTIFVRAKVFDALPTGAGNARQAFAVVKAGEAGKFFSYGLNDGTIPDGFGGQLNPTRLDTNIDNANQLEPGARMAVERVSLTCGPVRLKYPAAIANTTDPLVIAAYTGARSPNIDQPIDICDPFSLLVPREFTRGPQSLYPAVLDALRQAMVFEYAIGSANRGGRELCPGFLMGTGDAEPNVGRIGGYAGDSFFSIDEGILWDERTNKEGRLTIIATLEHEVVLPFTLPTTTVGAATFQTPTDFVFPLRLTVAGLKVVVGDRVNT